MTTGKISAGDRRTAAILNWAPWVSVALLTLAPTLFFLFFYFTSAEEAAVYLLLAMTSLVLGSASGLIVAIALLFYRRYWAGRLRERLAADGITAGEVPWFSSELTSVERRALKQMQEHSPALADAYCETLAIRLNASRVVAGARRELLQVQQRLNRATNIQGADTSALLQDLQLDRARLEGIKREGQGSLSEAEARLQTIEATAGRGSDWATTNYMLQRLNEGKTNVPMALESARLEQQIREDTERELREQRPSS
ncbi:MAG: hypothetical protein ABI596_03730 [Pyrinomonadaceae bacterium]